MISGIPRRDELNTADYLIALNDRYSREYLAQHGLRSQFRKDYKVGIGLSTCMDGRVHASAYTNLPIGLVETWRGAGGRFDLFDLSWTRFQGSVEEWALAVKAMGLRRIMLVSDHFSRREMALSVTQRHYGCKAFGYDEKKAQVSTRALKEQFDIAYHDEDDFHAVNCSFETDDEAIVFRGDDGSTVLDIGLEDDLNESNLLERFRAMYPAMNEILCRALVPIALGNYAHVAAIRRANRPKVETDHNEAAIAVGRGFENWIDESNLAFMIGPFDAEFEKVIEISAGLLKGNLESGRIKKENGVVVMTSAPIRPEYGPAGRVYKTRRAIYRMAQVRAIIEKAAPELRPHTTYLTTVVNMENQRMEVIERINPAA